jgi:predicted dehydrogenase
MNAIKVGFLGAGSIARSHAYALNSLKFYYAHVPEILLHSVCSVRSETRDHFAQQYGFKKAVDFEEFVNDQDIDTVFILGPNNTHFEHLNAVLAMKGVKRIYLEKPICANLGEEQKIKELLNANSSGKQIQVGFQLLFMSAIREALKWWHERNFGKPIHFNFTLKHGDYLNSGYRDKRQTRLTPAPDGGAMADLGCHALSLMVAFLGHDMKIVHALQGGSFPDVNEGSDLYSEISLYDKITGAVGTVSGSRVSAGTGDMLAFEIYAEKGALKFNSNRPDCFECFLAENGHWQSIFTGSRFSPSSEFPSGHVAGGWLRAMVHAHYVFATGDSNVDFIPGLQHGLTVQQYVREASEYMKSFRASKEN